MTSTLLIYFVLASVTVASDAMQNPPHVARPALVLPSNLASQLLAVFAAGFLGMQRGKSTF
jgi:hypothetical protein